MYANVKVGATNLFGSMYFFGYVHVFYTKNSLSLKPCIQNFISQNKEFCNYTHVEILGAFEHWNCAMVHLYVKLCLQHWKFFGYVTTLCQTAYTYIRLNFGCVVQKFGSELLVYTCTLTCESNF